MVFYLYLQRNIQKKKEMKKHFVLFVIMMLSMGVQAGEVLYAEIDGTNMTLKCGDSAPDGTAKYTSSDEWSRSFCNTITTVTIDASCSSYTGTTLAWLFDNFSQLENIIDLSNLNTANVTSMRAMFCGCRAFTSLDLSSFNTANVTDMSVMFDDCRALTSLDLSGFNTTNVTDMNGMFFDCFALTSVNLSGWDTANVTKMNSMFFNCFALTSLDLSSFNTANVTIMAAMFFQCTKLTTIYANNWDTNKDEQGSDMFVGCFSLVGGAGTVWSNKNANDRTLARIDGGSGAPGYFTDINATSVKDVTTAKMMTEQIPIYDLNGRRLTDKPMKGIYIQNGKKVVAK